MDTLVFQKNIIIDERYNEKKVCWINELGGCGTPLSYVVLAWGRELKLPSSWNFLWLTSVRYYSCVEYNDESDISLVLLLFRKNYQWIFICNISKKCPQSHLYYRHFFPIKKFHFCDGKLIKAHRAHVKFIFFSKSV